MFGMNRSRTGQLLPPNEVPTSVAASINVPSPAGIFKKEDRMRIGQYKSKPEVIQAILLTPVNADAVARWCGGALTKDYKPSDHSDFSITIIIPTIGNGTTCRAVFNDYVMKDPVTGRFFRMTKQEFEVSYDFDMPLEV